MPRTDPSSSTPNYRAVVLDIEGTTTPIAYVRETLFPFARERLASFVHNNPARAEVVAAVADAMTEIGGAASAETDAVQRLMTWIDEDRKVTTLKALQGLIWEAGYNARELIAPVYDDVLPALSLWKAVGVPVYVYSSGSILAQRLLFSHTSAGDLSRFFSGFFDTTFGSKRDAASYRRIQSAINVAAASVVFISDSDDEVAAAIDAGWQALLIARDGPLGNREHTISSFENFYRRSITNGKRSG